LALKPGVILAILSALSSSLAVLCLHVVLKVDDPAGMSIHLLMSDVE
jgi:hypothetical protein